MDGGSEAAVNSNMLHLRVLWRSAVVIIISKAKQIKRLESISGAFGSVDKYKHIAFQNRSGAVMKPV